MTHPSMGDLPEGPNPLPDGVSEEDVQDLMQRLVQEFETRGLYLEPPALVQTEDDRIVLSLGFCVGAVAFTDRVQNPIKDETDKQIRKMEAGVDQQDADEIMRLYRRDDE